MYLIRSLNESMCVRETLAPPFSITPLTPSHMVWMSENNMVECVSNPRCIRPEDYRPAENWLHRHDLNWIGEDQLGVLPLWRIFVTTYVRVQALPKTSQTHPDNAVGLAAQ